jgi:MFS family permease
LTTLFLVFVSQGVLVLFPLQPSDNKHQGIVIATAAHGTTVEGMFWMMVIGRGIAGVGAGKLTSLTSHNDSQADPPVTGGEYSVCTTQAVECADSTDALRKRRGLLVAVSTNVAIISGFVGSSIVSLIVIATYGGKASDGIWRICFGIGIFVSFVHSHHPAHSD